ncbi:hypothetical protein AB833_00450 [Chromatiales bacterium (ex Bugula neritina AB1)]|nr:hypothetical protein AB833_00450 [Chromatiales bacterium (ex Bugula neritina AB1)]
MPRLKWLEKYQERLLNCSHRQVVFTVPHELNRLWLHNTKELSNLLFTSVSNTLKSFLTDEKWLGAKAGYSLVLHTWGRNLSLHPHIHAVITEGGLSRDGKWVEPNYDCFLPAEAMMRKFRGAYISGIRKLIRENRLTMPEGQSIVQLRCILNKLYSEKKWNVRVEESYSHGEGIVKYLSRYLKGRPIRSHQVKQSEEGVKLRYKDHRTGLIRWQPFSKEKFVSQLLIHTPPTSMAMIRHYGLYASGCAKDREVARKQLKKSIIDFDMEEYLKSQGIDRSEKCSVCGRQMRVTEIEKKKWVH